MAFVGLLQPNFVSVVNPMISPWILRMFVVAAALGAAWHAWHLVPLLARAASPDESRFNYPEQIVAFAGRQVRNPQPLPDPQRVPFLAAMEVAGVEIEGETRAYLLGGMSAVDYHLAYDSVGGHSIGITYCPRLSVVRCLVIPRAQQARLKVHGWVEDTMKMKFEGEVFSIEDESLPLPELPVEITTLEDWRQRHPDSTIYLGDLPLSPSDDIPLQLRGRPAAEGSDR